MKSTETLKRMVLIFGMLVALTAGGAFARPRVLVLASSWTSSHAGAPDVGYPNCMTCRTQDRASTDGGDMEMATGRGRWSGNEGGAKVQTGKEPSS